jgi:predicted dehydrogenase
MAEAARSKGVLLMEAFMYRFHPRTQAVVDMVRKGTLGDLKVIRSGFTFAVTDPGNIRLQADLGGGSLMDVGCYCVNVSRTLVGDEPVEVQAFAKWSETGVDEEMVASLRFPNGVVAQFNCGLTIHRQEFYQVVGQKSHLDVPAAFLPGKGPVELHHVQSGGGETRQIPGADEYQLMVEHFSDCLEKDMVPRYQASEAAANMRVIEALYRSARNRGELEQVEGRVMGNG